MPKRGGKGGNAPIVIRRSEPEGEAGHHGGAWKIAYADFVTAMMAFFLLMWLINATTESQRRGIADYFAPINPLGRSATGAGQPFGGRTLNSQGEMTADSPVAQVLRQGLHGIELEEEMEEEEDSQRRPPTLTQAPRSGAERQNAERQEQGQGQQEQAQREAQRRALLAEAAEEIRQAVRSDPALAELGRQLMVEEVPEGLRIQVVDAEGQPLFATGHGAPNERGRALLQRAATVIARMPYPVEVTGHTDAAPFRGGDRTNWELSADRANATRRLLVESGVAEGRIRAVAGRADRELLVPAQPLDPANRRVAVLVLMPNIATLPQHAAAGGAPSR